MKKTIALVLTLVILLSASAFPVSAAQPRILEYFCSMCGALGEKVYQDSLDPYHFYVNECFEYLEPHYHSILNREVCIRCINEDCRIYRVIIETGNVEHYDVCHYGE